MYSWVRYNSIYLVGGIVAVCLLSFAMSMHQKKPAGVYIPTSPRTSIHYRAESNQAQLEEPMSFDSRWSSVQPSGRPVRTIAVAPEPKTPIYWGRSLSADLSAIQ